MTGLGPTLSFKLVAASVLYLFLPLTALAYCISRRSRRAAAVERILAILEVDSEYRKVYESDRTGYYVLSLAYASAVSWVGLALLFFSSELGFSELPAVHLGDVEFPEIGSRLVVAMAFLGAYLWGIQDVFRRYVLNDVTPSVYYGLSMRMILAAAIALVIYNGYAALAGDVASNGGITANIWPSLAFVVGMFPRRGLRWLTGRIPMVSSNGDPSVRSAPLAMIEGVDGHDALRLEELGIDNCYDLATADFVPLLLRTPYSARQLIDFLLQAKACVYFGDAITDLRRHGIRTILDLEPLSAEDVEVLAKESRVTKQALERARASVETDPSLERLREAGRLLGRFWKREEAGPVPP